MGLFVLTFALLSGKSKIDKGREQDGGECGSKMTMSVCGENSLLFVSSFFKITTTDAPLLRSFSMITSM